MSDVDQLRDRLRTAPPDFAPIPSSVIRAKVRRRRRRAAGVATVAVVALLTAGALVVPRLALDRVPVAAPAPVPTVPTPTVHPCPSTPSGSPVGIVDYVAFVRFQGRDYLRTAYEGTPTLGPRVGVVSCDLAAIQPPGGYRTADGDAAGLPAGTTLHSTPGLPVWFRLVTSTGATYEARPQEPTVGGDELPLRGLVTKIGVYSARPYPAKPLLRAEVTDPAEVRAVVDAIVTAPLVVRGIQRPTGSLRFWLADGTYVERTWSRSERLLDQWIPLSADVLRIISPDPPG